MKVIVRMEVFFECNSEAEAEKTQTDFVHHIAPWVQKLGRNAMVEGSAVIDNREAPTPATKAPVPSNMN